MTSTVRYAANATQTAFSRAVPPFFVAYPASKPARDALSLTEPKHFANGSKRSSLYDDEIPLLGRNIAQVPQRRYQHSASKPGSSLASGPSVQGKGIEDRAESHEPEVLPSYLRTEQTLPYRRLRPIIDALPGPKDWAIAYGSGVQAQANAQPNAKPPLTDFILSTPSAADFHTNNIRQNPSHYPLSARLLGGSAVGWLQDKWGAGVWYVSMVKIKGMDVKYGVISTDRLIRDLTSWETLYVAGRLHKPVLPLIQPESMVHPLRINTSAALRLSLLILPETFTEHQLYEQIAGISYSGDPRMAVPGAENPEKVRNIVRGPGALEGFRQIYLREAQDLGVVVGEKVETAAGEATLRQPVERDHQVRLLQGLPASLRNRLVEHNKGAASNIAQDGGNEQQILAQLVASPAFKRALLEEVKNIIRRPALTQTVKGLFTAGFRKSVLYSLEKIKKWLAARNKPKKA